ncbi:hypothetical protein [Pseudomethylobacillus aquaticus]|nr:hypothetical protein [Pseudomethylobacillus aquaticus]
MMLHVVVGARPTARYFILLVQNKVTKQSAWHNGNLSVPSPLPEVLA